MKVQRHMQGNEPFSGVHQKRALKRLLVWDDGKLKTRSGKTMEELSDELGMSRAQLDRYLNGRQPLRSDQFAAFARALSTTEEALIRACFPSLTVAAEPTMRDLLEEVGLPEDEIQQLLSSMAGQETTLDERTKIAAFVAEVIALREPRQHNNDARRRA